MFVVQVDSMRKLDFQDQRLEHSFHSEEVSLNVGIDTHDIL